MKHIVIIAMCLVLVGCERAGIHDYSPETQDMRESLKECQHKAIIKYNDSELPMTGDQMAGAIVGGALGGAVGGAIFGSAIGSSVDERHTMKTSEIEPYVDDCMADEGYVKKDH